MCQLQGRMAGEPPGGTGSSLLPKWQVAGSTAGRGGRLPVWALPLTPAPLQLSCAVPPCACGRDARSTPPLPCATCCSKHGTPVYAIMASSVGVMGMARCECVCVCARGCGVWSG